MSKLATNAPNAHAQKLVASYVRAGYVQIDPPILQPAEPFLDLSGEDIRRRLFLTSDPNGRELCLRPDLTIPVSRAYLQSPRAGEAAGFCYLGIGVSPSRRRRRRVRAGRDRVPSRGKTRRRPTPKCWRLGSRRPLSTA